MVYTYDASLFHPWHAKLLVNVEFILAFFLLLRLCRSALFFILCSMLGTLVYTGHVREVGKAVQTLIRACSKMALHEIPLGLHWILREQIREHNLVCYLVCAEIVYRL